MWIVKIQVKFTNYVKVIEEELPRMLGLEGGVEFTDSESAYIMYFKASLQKKLGFYIESMQLFEDIRQDFSQ